MGVGEEQDPDEELIRRPRPQALRPADVRRPGDHEGEGARGEARLEPWTPPADGDEGEDPQARPDPPEVGEERAPGVLDEEPRELLPGLVLGADHMPDGWRDQVLRRPDDEPGDPLQEAVPFFEGEGELPARPASREFAGHREPGGP